MAHDEWRPAWEESVTAQTYQTNLPSDAQPERGYSVDWTVQHEARACSSHPST